MLILDEVAAPLDSFSERLVQGELDPATRGCNTVAIVRRLALAVAADVSFVVEAGRIIER